MQLRLTDGTTTINLADNSTASVVRYVPKYPKFSAAPASSMDVLPAGRYDPVVEGCQVDLLGSAATQRATLASLHKMMQTAADYASGVRGTGLAAVYVELKPLDGDAAYYRSLVSNITIELDEDALDWRMPLGTRTRALITWTRAPWWEGAEAELPLNTTAASNVTGGLTLYGYEDSTASRFCRFWINAADIAGDMPAPLKWTGTYNGSVNWLTTVSLSQSRGGAFNYGANPAATPVWMFPANAGSPWSAQSYTWTSTSAYVLSGFTLPSTFAALVKGGLGRVVLRLASPGAYIDLRMGYHLSQATVSGTTVIYKSGYTQAYNKSVIECSPVRFPPDYNGAVSNSPYILQPFFQRPSGSTAYVYLESVAVMAAGGWRRLSFSLFPLDTNYTWIDDPYNVASFGGATAADNTGRTSGAVVESGDPLMVVPGQRTDLFYQAEFNNYYNYPTKTSTVRCYYRPRRLSV